MYKMVRTSEDDIFQNTSEDYDIISPEGHKVGEVHNWQTVTGPFAPDGGSSLIINGKREVGPAHCTVSEEMLNRFLSTGEW